MRIFELKSGSIARNPAISPMASKRVFVSRKVAMAAALACVLAAISPQTALAFDPEKVFKEQKPSAGQLFKHYLEKKNKGEADEAYDVLKYAADQGNQTAQWKLGRMYELGDGVQQSPKEAFTFYKMIADRYGEAQPGKPEWRITGKAMVALGHYYVTGIPEAGVKPDLDEARVMFTTSAMYFRDVDAQFELGKLLLEGGNSPEEARQGIRMLNLARKKGHPGAQALLGNALVEGEYVLQDVVRGLSMLTRAAKNATPEMRGWIEDLQQQAFALASEEERRQAILSVQQ